MLRRTRGANLGSLLTVRGFAPAQGLIYPIVVVVNRRSIVTLLRTFISLDSLDFAGLVVLSLEVISCTPQFFILTRYVIVARPSRAGKANPSTHG